jgi:hypothetical protein
MVEFPQRWLGILCIVCGKDYSMLWMHLYIMELKTSHVVGISALTCSSHRVETHGEDTMLIVRMKIPFIIDPGEIEIAIDSKVKS